MQSPQLDHVRVMRTAAWIWLGYLAAQAGVDALIYGGVYRPPTLWYHLMNALPALVFLGLAYSKWLNNGTRLLTPGMILLVSAAPILANHLLTIPLPRAPLSNIEGMVMRQLPVLFIGLVLVAWHYGLVTMILYSLGTNAFELVVVFAMGQMADPRLESFYFITIIRTVCFIVVGVFINQLITRLRSQQEALISANARLAQHASMLETLTVSRERNRMSRELHDTVIHTLSGLTVQLETAKAYWKVNPETTEKLLEQSLAATRTGLQETRRALKALRARPLEDLGLVIAIQKMVETAAERGKLTPVVELPDPSLTLKPEVEQCIYRVAQEAVENVVQHASAQHLTVRLAVVGKGVELLVQDDGLGFKQENGSVPGHFGLPGMQERAQLVGGKLDLTSQPGGGTKVQLIIEGCVQ